MGALDAAALLACAALAAAGPAYAERTAPPDAPMSPADRAALPGPGEEPDPAEPPAWPRGSVMELTWRVSALTNAGSGSESKAIELMVSVGEVSRTIRLAPRAGAVVARNQPVCLTTLRHRAGPAAALAKPEVAKIAFDRDATTGYLVRRGSTGDVLVVDEWEQSRNACLRNNRPVKPCPRAQSAVAMLPIPPGIKFHEALVEVDSDGIAHPIECK